MKAIVCSRYGSPDALRVAEMPRPIPGDNEIRIRIRAAVVTPADCAFRKADPFFIRLMYGLVRPRYAVLGVEFAGEVDAVGKEVATFAPGDPVIGISPRTFGTYAEYKCLPEESLVAPKPGNLTFEEAAGLCDGALTALVFLRDKAKLQRGQHVLINGASGSVGAYAVQLAKHFGAEVTGVCSAANAAFVTSLGADRVIDYTRDDFTRNGRTYDVIFDAVGKRTFPQCKHSLAPAGIYLSTVPTPGIMLHMLRTAKSRGRRAIFAATGLKQRVENLHFLRKLAEAGIIKPVIDRRYPLEQIAEAHRYVESGRKKGNVVLVPSGE
ncbi:NAD(P)-dependent alcohol dehydrogenase [Paenibacillus cymbidii]|uniref:NAD(P)-dependent alcohol dehydrogenase n=1 Tax=Paenibacillus cymbidii TaxID=1639034 RepID=UPI0010818C40|nr:NAD(P)-dependent alcohol dehydrogenase [Paenibacillus cymbidii]